MTREQFLAATKLSETKRLHYVGGYKYQSRNDMIYKTGLRPEEDIITDLIVLREDGWLWVSQYFAWDGCSGPTWDDSTNMRAGQAHDALYALHRMGLLPLEARPQSDQVLHDIMISDGAVPVRAGYYQFAVNRFAAGAADPKNARRVMVAPRDRSSKDVSSTSCNQTVGSPRWLKRYMDFQERR